MKERRVWHIVREIEELRVPDSIDHWPAIRAGVAQRQRLGWTRLTPIKRLGWAAAMVGLAIAVTLMVSPQVRAQVGEAVQQIGSRIVVVQATPVLRMEGAGTYYVQSTPTDLRTAQSKVSFPIWQPKYLPAGYELRRVGLYNGPPDEGRGVELNYQGPIDGTPHGIVIFQSKPPVPQRVSVGKNKALAEVDFDGMHGVVYVGSDSPRRLVMEWTDGSRWFSMFSTEGLEEVVRVAHSVGP